MSPLLVSMFIFVLLAVGGVAICASLSDRDHALGERFSDMSVKMRVAYGTLRPDEIEERGVAHTLFRWALEKMPEPQLNTPEGRKIVRVLIQAGYTHSTAPMHFQFVRLASALAGTLAGVGLTIVLHLHGLKPVLAMIFGAGIGAWIPYYYVMRKARNRQAQIAGELSNVLDLLVVCVEAGLGMNEAIKIVGSETDRQGQMIGHELAMVSAELAAGSSLGQALRGLADRTNVEDIKPLAATMIQSEQLGAQMGPALRSISDGLRNSRRLRAEEAAQKTTVKILFPLVFFILPAMMAGIVGPAMIQIMRTMTNTKF